MLGHKMIRSREDSIPVCVIIFFHDDWKINQRLLFLSQRPPNIDEEEVNFIMTVGGSLFGAVSVEELLSLFPFFSFHSGSPSNALSSNKIVLRQVNQLFVCAHTEHLNHQRISIPVPALEMSRSQKNLQMGRISFDF